MKKKPKKQATRVKSKPAKSPASPERPTEEELDAVGETVEEPVGEAEAVAAEGDKDARD